jgi:AraC-like DNA-binding protein
VDGGDAERLAQAVAASLDIEDGMRELPRLTFHSRTQFYRIFRAVIEETPGEMRRRLLLERAAWRLSRTDASITEIALDAGYGSLEAFTALSAAHSALHRALIAAWEQPGIIWRHRTRFTSPPRPIVRRSQKAASPKENLWTSTISLPDTIPGTRSSCWKPRAA